MIDKKSMLAEFAKSKKPAIAVSIENESPEQEQESSPMEMACPHCGAKISLAASKSQEPQEEEISQDSQPE